MEFLPVLRISLLPLLLLLLQGGLSRGECSCRRSFKPVCGTDGRTYNSPCHLDCAAAKAPPPGLKTAYKGTCCPQPICPPVKQPICDSDGHTHENECMFRYAFCVLRKSAGRLVRVASKGPCATLPGPAKVELCDLGCEGSRRRPVCDTAGATHQNLCWLATAQCLARRDPTAITPLIAYSGPCLSDAPAATTRLMPPGMAHSFILPPGAKDPLDSALPTLPAVDPTRSIVHTPAPPVPPPFPLELPILPPKNLPEPIQRSPPKPEPDNYSKVQSSPESEPEPETKAEPSAEPELKPEPELKSTMEYKSQLAPEPEPKSEPAPETESSAEPTLIPEPSYPEPTPESEASPEPSPEPEAAYSEPWPVPAQKQPSPEGEQKPKEEPSPEKKPSPEQEPSPEPEHALPPLRPFETTSGEVLELTEEDELFRSPVIREPAKEELVCSAAACKKSYAPVCDNRGRTHMNPCVFEFSACLMRQAHGKELGVVFSGPCSEYKASSEPEVSSRLIIENGE